MRKAGTNLLIAAWLPVTLVLAWWFFSANSTSPYWPSLSRILSKVQEVWLFDRFVTDLVPTLIRVGAGLSLAIVLGISLGALIGASERVRVAVEPALEFIRAVPLAAVIPITILVFGINDGQKVFLIVLVAIWPILLNTVDGMRGIDRSYHDLARVYGLRRRDRVLRLIVPAVMPQAFAGIRVALAFSLLVVVVAEMFASQDGLGHFILTAQHSFRVVDMWSGIIVLAVVAYLVNTLFLLIEQRVLYWHRGWRASALQTVAEPRRPGSFARSLLSRARRVGRKEGDGLRA